MSRPGPKRSRGGSRSPRTISQVSSPSARRAASGFASSSIPRRAARSSAATPPEARPQAVVEVEGGREPERHLALHPLELGDPLHGTRALGRARRRTRTAGAAAAPRAAPPAGGRARSPRARGRRRARRAPPGRAAATSTIASTTVRKRGSRAIWSARFTSPACSRCAASAASRSCSASARAASRSSRTVSSAEIASSFMSAPTACCENLALSKRSVSRRAACGLTDSSASMRPRYSSGASAGRRGSRWAARTRSSRAYAAITARRGSGSARRSSSDSSTAAASSAASRSSSPSSPRARLRALPANHHAPSRERRPGRR